MTGRQPRIDYVTKDYEGFKQGMLNQIPLLLPDWTDRGEADFGVVLIELVAYVADILSYYQDRVANEAFLATATQRRSVTELLRLIGYQIDPGLAASAVVHVDVTTDLDVGPDELPFQVRTAGRPGEVEVTFEVIQPFSLRPANNEIPLAAIPALPAGTAAVELPPGAHRLVPGYRVYLEERPAQPARPRRSPPLTVTGVRRLVSGDDEISWLPPLPASFQPGATVLRGNNIVATHGVTVADEPVYVADGTPGQRFTLARTPVTHLLRTEDTRRRRSRPELEVRVDGAPWRQVESLSASGPADLHYTTEIDENDVMTVVFGTGARGSVPTAGAEVRARYRIGLGVVGNVGPDVLTVPTSLAAVAAVTNPFAAEGGADRESTEEAKIAGPGSVIAQERAVTLEDYELLAAGVEGVGKARARVGLRGGYKVVQVFIAPENPLTVPPPPPSDDLRATVARRLESRMPVNRMAGVEVLDPAYVPIDITVEVHLTAEASRSQAVEEVRGLLTGLLSFSAQDFGRPVRAGEVFSALFPLDGVEFVLLRELRRRDRPAGGSEFADVPLADHELAFAGTIVVVPLGGGR
ncbi:putative baseplate assembly protein [Streptosporangium sp. NPDC005286]|uniref:putative baseplate assembly protein n=1 Tax=Streptosporangium sp. NPDC005286 TaxID=3154463 RepID=UPI0033B4F994